MKKKGKILIVEDSRTQAVIISNKLLEAGYEVKIAENGLKAIECINASPDFYPDMIISDIHMPEMDGLQLCRLIKRVNPDILFIILTASEDIEMLKESFESGAIDFINKPVKEVELLVRITNVLRIKRAEEDLKQAFKQLSESNKRLEELSVTDALTRLFNRKYTVDKLDEHIEFSRRYQNKLSIAIIDLDHFKNVNDKYGHNAGDEVLVKAAEVFKQNIRKTDTIGRYGGEEFLLIAPNIPGPNCLIIVEKLLDIVKELKFGFDETYRLTFSAGVFEYNNESVDDFIEKADQRLYQAKESGRNRVVI